MQSYTAFTGFVAQIGWGDLQRIERPAVVLNDDLHVLAPQLEAHHNIVAARVVIAVGDDVIENFVKRHIQCDDDAVR